MVHDAEVGAPKGAEEVYRDESARLWRAMVAFSGDRELAADVVAEAFAQLLRRGDEVRDPSAWVWRASFAIARGALAARAHESLGQGSTVVLGAASDESFDLMRALDRLPANQRAVIVLRHLLEMPTAEVASTLGMSPPTVRVHSFRARKRLAEILEVRDD